MLPFEAKQFRARCPRRRAFSLIELLVVLGILIILCSIFIPYVGKMREANKRVGCADNLRQIHTAFTQYGSGNNLDYPRMPWDLAKPAAYVAYSGASFVSAAPASRPAGGVGTLPTAPSTNPAIPAVPGPSALAPDVAPATQPSTAPTTSPATFSAPRLANGPIPAADGMRLNDVTGSLWLLVRLGYVQPQAFVCASAAEALDPMLTAGKRVPADQRSNFTSGQHLSYSYCSPYSAAPRFRLNSDVLPPDFAIMADKNPGTSGNGDNAIGPSYDAPPLSITVANSRNHDRAGQNVLYVTGEVKFQNTPYCGYGDGWKRDNIYSAHSTEALPPGSKPAPEVNGAISPNIGPAWEYDSYLVPTDDE